MRNYQRAFWNVESETEVRLSLGIAGNHIRRARNRCRPRSGRGHSDGDTYHSVLIKYFSETPCSLRSKPTGWSSASSAATTPTIPTMLGWEPMRKLTSSSRCQSCSSGSPKGLNRGGGGGGNAEPGGHASCARRHYVQGAENQVKILG
jgi:hypothetical protein